MKHDLSQLLPDLRRGDPRALDAVVLACRARLYSFLLRLVRRAEVAEELLQETFLRLVRHAAGLPDHTRLDLWLYTVARNLARSWWRWSIVDGERLLQVAAGWLGAPPPPDPLERAVADERARLTERAIGGLPLAYREVALLVAVEQLSHEEVGAVLGLRADAVRQRWSRALAMLRDAGGVDAV